MRVWVELWVCAHIFLNLSGVTYTYYDREKLKGAFAKNRDNHSTVLSVNLHGQDLDLISHPYSNFVR